MGVALPQLTVGVLALQGAFSNHLSILATLGVEGRAVRLPVDLEGVDGLVLPGGESTTMSMLLDSSGLREPIAELLERGLPVLGTCAGLILLSRRVRDGRADQRGFGVLDVETTRNAYGRQNESFESTVDLRAQGSIPGIFIRAPRIVEVGPGVEVLGTLHGEPVLVRDGGAIGCAFHPELSGDTTVHRLLIDQIGRSLTTVADASQED
ncbi:MAG: pyridoxal 5'-phosphate synthase glutaminase subunit PdxT [Ilumatobacteraceae bacterium]